MDEEERLRRIAEIKNELGRREQLGILKTVDAAKRAATAPALQAQNVSTHEKNRALAGADIPDLVKVLEPSLAVPGPETQAKVDELTLRTRSDALGSDPQENLSRDIEGALKRRGREIVSNDQRLVVDERGAPLATREEYPPVLQHWKEVVSGPDQAATPLGAFLNTLGATTRVPATAINHLFGAGKTADLPRDLLQAAGNVKGNTVAEGGAVASRGTGFGDVGRVIARDAKPGATFGEAAFPMLPDGGKAVDKLFTPLGYGKAALMEGMEKLTGVDPAFLGSDKTGAQERDELVKKYGAGRPFKDPNDPAFDIFGEATGLVADPLNFVPVEKLATLPLKAAAKLPGAAGRAGGKALALATTDITKLGSAENKLARGLARAGEDDAARIAAEVKAAQRQAGAEASTENAFQEKLLAEAAGAIDSTRAAEPARIIERSLREIPEHEVLLRIRNAAADGQGLTTLERSLIDQAPWEQIARGEVPEALPLRLNRQRLADKLGVDVFQPHALEATDPALLGAAKNLGRVNRRNLELLQEQQRLGMGVRADGYMPRPDIWATGEKLAEKGVPRPLVNTLEALTKPFRQDLSYNPLKPREMARLADHNTLRSAAASAVGDGLNAPKVARTLQPQDVDFLHDFAANPGKASPEDLDYARSLLAESEIFLPKPSGTLDEANRMVENRMARGSGHKVETPVAFMKHDAVRAVAAHRDAVQAPIKHGRTAQLVSDVKDANGERIVQSLEEAIYKPRRLANPEQHGRLIEALRLNPGGPAAGLLTDGHLTNEVSHFLAENKLKLVGQGDPLLQVMPQLGGKVLPVAVYKDLLEVAPRMLPGVLEKAAGAMTLATRVWLPFVLGSPGFHIRNAFFGQFQVFQAVGERIADVRLWRAAGEIASAAEKGGAAAGDIVYAGRKWNKADLVDEVQRYGIFEAGMTRELEDLSRAGGIRYRDQGVGGALKAGKPLRAAAAAVSNLASPTRGLVTKEPLAKIAAARGVGTALSMGAGTATAENVQRIFVYLAKRMAEGQHAGPAANHVVKFMFDYTGAMLRPSERAARRFFPFYNWMKQSLLLQVDQMLKNPKRYVQVNHLYETMDAMARGDSNRDPRLVPTHVQERGAIASPIPMPTLPGSDAWMAMERPGTQANWLLDPALRGSPTGVIRNLAKQLGAPARVPVEVAVAHAFGRPLQAVNSDRPMSPNFVPEVHDNAAERLFQAEKHDIPEYLLRSFGGTRGWGGELILDELIPEYSPKNPRFAGADERNRILRRAVSLLFGPQLMETRPEDISLDQARQVAETNKKLQALEVDLAKRRLAAEGR